jgi:hypothetical protein
LDFGSSNDVCALRCTYRWRTISEQAFDEIQGTALVAAFFCASDSVVVVVGGVGSSAVSWWQTIFGFAVVVRDRHHVAVCAMASEARYNLVMVTVVPGRRSEKAQGLKVGILS